jgi:peptide/nickel transport system substrate-binding protein
MRGNWAIMTTTGVTRRRILVSAALTAVLPLPHAHAEGGTSKVVLYASPSGPSTIDPHMAGALVEMEVVNLLFEAIVTLDAKYNPKLLLASQLTVSPDAKVYTFRLREDVVFQNGKTMTSADVLASFERYKAISPNSAILNDATLAAPTSNSFVVTFSKPNPTFLNAMATPLYPMAILPAEQKLSPGRAVDLVGSGPFRLVDWQKDSFLLIEKFDRYRADPLASAPDGYAGKKTVEVDRVRFNFLPEANVRVAALQTGEVDVASSIPPPLAKRFAADRRITKQETFPWAQAAFILNSRNGLTANPLIRQAIQAVVNVDDMMEATGMLSRRNPSLLYPDSPYYQGDQVAPFYSRDNLDAARDLLGKAGYKGEAIRLQTNSNYPFHRDAILVLAEAMKAAGMAVDVQVLDWVSNSDNMQHGTGNWNVSTTTFTPAPLLGPQQWRNQLYNFAQIKDDKGLDDAYEMFLTSTAPEDRKVAWGKIEQRILGQAYFIKIGDYGIINAYGPRVQGLSPYVTLRFNDVVLQA